MLCAKSLQSCPTLFDPMDCSPPGSSVHGILQARIVERVAIASSRGSSCPRDQACASYVSYVAGGFFTSSSTRKAPCTHTHICITQTQHTYMLTHTHPPKRVVGRPGHRSCRWICVSRLCYLVPMPLTQTFSKCVLRTAPAPPCHCSLCGNRVNVFRPMIGAIWAEMKSMGCDRSPF